MLASWRLQASMPERSTCPNMTQQNARPQQEIPDRHPQRADGPHTTVQETALPRHHGDNEVPQGLVDRHCLCTSAMTGRPTLKTHLPQKCLLAPSSICQIPPLKKNAKTSDRNADSSLQSTCLDANSTRPERTTILFTHSRFSVKPDNAARQLFVPYAGSFY